MGVASGLPRAEGLTRRRNCRRDRIVIRFPNVIVHPALGIQTIGNEGPIECARVVGPAADGCGRTPGRSHRLVEAGVAESPRGFTVARIHVEIPADREHRPIFVSPAVLQHLSQLPEAKGVLPLLSR